MVRLEERRGGEGRGRKRDKVVKCKNHYLLIQ